MGRLALSLAGWIAFAPVSFAEKDSTETISHPLKVTVIDETDAPVAGAQVYTSAYSDWPAQAATTDEQGVATLNIPPKRSLGLVILADDGRNMGHVQLPWSHVPPETFEPVTIGLAPARSMQVRVVDDLGNAVEDATVLVQAAYREAARQTTDEEGRALLRVPRSISRQAVIAMKSGVGLDYLAFAREGAPITSPNLLDPSHDAPIELVLNGSRKVLVEVVDQDGNPLPEVNVAPWLYLKPGKGEDLNMGGMPDFQYTTDQQGRCFFEAPLDLERATTVWARLHGYAAPERATYDPKSIEPVVQAKLERMVNLSGTVSLPDGVKGSDIILTVAGDGHGLDDFRAPAVNVNDDGSFELPVNLNMYYQLVAGDQKQWASPGVNVVVLDQDIDGIRLRLLPATRVHGRVQVSGTGAPVPGKYLQLYQRTVNSYYDLPDVEQIPNPTDSNYAISPIIVQSKQTDQNGEFEFFAGPGSYYITGIETGERPDFVIGGEQELNFVIEIQPAEMRKNQIVQGKVFLAANEEHTVASARVFSYPIDSFSGNHIDATCDSKGQFEALQILGPHLLHANATIDGKVYAGIAEVTAEDETYNVPVAPAAKLVGRFVDSELGIPLENRDIRCAIQIEYADGISTSAFGGSATTDENGNFEIDGLVVGWTYTLTVTTDVDADGHGRSFRDAGEVTPAKPGEFEQEFQGSALDFPPTFAPIGKQD